MNIIYAGPTLVKPECPGDVPSPQVYSGDAGYDLKVSQHVTIEPHEFVDVPTGLQIALPEGYWGMITGRSSTIRKYGLHVPTGVIDNGWRGDLFVGAYNLGPDTVRLYAGDRIGQLILFPLVHTHFVVVDSLPPSDRGTNGFGSTGT